MVIKKVRDELKKKTKSILDKTEIDNKLISSAKTIHKEYRKNLVIVVALSVVGIIFLGKWQEK